MQLLKIFATKISVVDCSEFLFFLFKGIVDLVIQPSTCEDELKGLFDPSKVYDYITGIAHGKVLQVCVLLKYWLFQTCHLASEGSCVIFAIAKCAL